MQTSRLVSVAAATGTAVVLATRLMRRRRAISFANKVVVIVGGSRGLGLVIARHLGLEGARLALVARESDTLDRAVAELVEAGSTASSYVCDVTDRRQVEATIGAIASEHGGIDVLINDAGVMAVGPLDHMTVDDFDEALATHCRGPLVSVLAALPHMRRGGARRIVNISSIGGRIAVPHMLPYTASKYALTGLSEGLHAELAQEGFVVTTVCPGLMRTGSTYNARFKGRHRREFAWFHLSAAAPGLSMSADRAARQIIDACRYGDTHLTITWPARLAVLAHALSPSLVTRVMALVNQVVLPSADGDHRTRSYSGWQSMSRFIPSKLTTLADRAAARNNEWPPAEQKTPARAAVATVGEDSLW